MRVLVINSVYGTGSTGRIAIEVAESNALQGDEIRYAYGRADYVPKNLRTGAYRIGGALGNRLHAIMTRVFDRHGTGICSRAATKRFLKWADDYNPDLLWLHNLHGYYINYELLFKWIKSRPQMKVKWMLHDCWAFTGHCSHYTHTGCDRYKTQCFDCPQRNDYPKSLFVSNARRNFEAKKRAFLGVKNLTLVIPSDWLAAQVRSGFLKNYPIEMRRHIIDRTVFKPTESNFRVRHGLEGKKMVLCVASQWDNAKGFPDVIKLAGIVGADWRIVMVGLEQRQISHLPSNIIGFKRTNSTKELAELYSASDWFFNPTREDIYSMTNMEAAACGTKIVSYDTGGAPEAVAGYDKAVLLSNHTPEAAWEVMRG